MVLAALSMGMNGLCAQENVEQTNWPKTAAKVALGGLCLVLATNSIATTNTVYTPTLVGLGGHIYTQNEIGFTYLAKGLFCALFGVLFFDTLFEHERKPWNSDMEIYAKNATLSFVCLFAAERAGYLLTSAAQILTQS